MSTKKQKNAKKAEKLSKEKMKKISGGALRSPTPIRSTSYK
jgi:bacteriocin-like protein